MDTVEDVNMADIDTEVDETEQDCVEQVSSEYDSMYKAMGLHAVEGETPKTGDMSKYVISDSADDLEIPSSMKRPSCSMAELGLPEQQKKKKKMTNYNRLELT
jgi:Tat protein secretion system quality control protein TatD with DNase activity